MTEPATTSTESINNTKEGIKSNYLEKSFSPRTNSAIVENELNLKCSCKEHHGKEMLNKVFDFSVNFLWESIFGDSYFCINYWETRKFTGFTSNGLKWKKCNDIMRRNLEYSVDLGAFGKAKNIEEQVIRFLNVPNSSNKREYSFQLTHLK